MIRHVRRGSLLVAFSLLTSAVTAHAERAWVLWSQRTWKDASTRDRCLGHCRYVRDKSRKGAALHEPGSQSDDRTIHLLSDIADLFAKAQTTSTAT